MKLNYRPIPNRVAFIDYETQSNCPLSTTHKYATHESTRVLTCCVKTPDGKMHRIGPYLDGESKRLLTNIAQECTMVAHNAPFDGAIHELCAGMPEAEWFDTLPCARAAGFAGKLDVLGKLICGRGKDKNGERLIDMLCILRPNQKTPALGPAHDLLLDYNERDVDILEQIYHRVKKFGEPRVMELDYVINQRGLPMDRQRLLALIQLYERNSADKREQFAEMSRGVNPGSPKQVKDWMDRMGFKMPSINKMAMKELTEAPADFFLGDDSEFSAAWESLHEAMEVRREIVRVGKSKAEKALEVLESDDRVREQFVYWGAHTGRWSGRAMQIHNFPVQEVDVSDVDPTMENVVRIAKEHNLLNADVLNAMLRSVVRCDNMLVADYNAVEARGIAWLADEGKLLELFADPTRSAYLDMGRALFGREISKKADPLEYLMAKTLILGCGYGMSGAKFAYTCKSRGIYVDVFAKEGKRVEDFVKVYRATYPNIVKVWADYHRAIHEAVGHNLTVFAGKCHFYMEGPDLHIKLPSGRPIVYRNARIEPRVPGYCKFYGMPETPVPTVVFDSARLFTGFLYGSKVAENICQGVCRDLVADAMLNCESESLNPFIHVHDEIACEKEEKHFPLFMEIMTTAPEWAKGFPIMAEGYTGAVWTKMPKHYRVESYIDSRRIAA